MCGSVSLWPCGGLTWKLVSLYTLCLQVPAFSSKGGLNLFESNAIAQYGKSLTCLTNINDE